ncbi:MAG: hypothetical protein EHM64_09970 [Ignavibacteriae bacterium]|nr:MAG: hypothetical protein EHM64_09970 [Ignavibacteriota bacterium]
MTMRQTFYEALLLIAAAIILGFAYTYATKQGFFAKTQPAPAVALANIDMISLDQARGAFESRQSVFVDARHEFDFLAGHIQGAVNIPLKMYGTLQSRLGGVAKDKLLIVYCDGAECNSSIELSIKLLESGFTNVKVFFGGWQEWKSAGLPTEQ